MSKIVLNKIQLGTSATATNNFVIKQPDTPDGTLRIQNGNDGATTDKIVISATGVAITGSLSATGMTLDASGNLKVPKSFQETQGTVTIANGSSFDITIPTPRRYQLLTIQAPYNLNQGGLYLVHGDGSGTIIVDAIVNKAGATVVGLNGTQVRITNNYGGTTDITWTLLPLAGGL